MVDSHMCVPMKRNVRPSIPMQKRLKFPRKLEYC